MPETDQIPKVSEIADLFELHQKEKYESFHIHSHVEILYILRKIMEKNTLVTLYFDYGNQFILTSILSIDIEKNKMVLDYGINEKLNEIVLQKERLIFITSQDRIKVEFACNTIEKMQFEDHDAFVVNMPESLIRMQRRSHFRITTPITKPLKCIVPLQEEEQGTNTAEITILDISCGGIGVIDHHPTISFDPGTIYENCKVTLPVIGTINVTVEVKNTYEITLRNGLACKRAGCEFIAISESTQAMLQRYIAKQEQLRKTS